MAEVSSCKSKHSPLGKITTVAVITSPPRKSEASPQPVDTSSQASVEGAEASLEDLPANISLVATAYSSRSVSPLVDPSEIQANANTAIDNMLHLKRSMDVKSQSKSQETTSVTEARAICSLATLDVWIIYSQSVLEAITNCLVVVKEAKTIRCSLIQKAEAACSKAICKAAALRISQSIVFHREHSRYMQDLEEQAFGEESRSHHDYLSTCQVALSHNPEPLRGALATSYHILLGQAPPSPQSVPPQKAPPVEE